MWNVKDLELLKSFEHLDTASVSDALDSLNLSGGIPGIRARVPSARCVGFAYTVQYQPFAEKPKEFQNAGNYIDNVPANSVVVIDNGGRSDCTNWGNILTAVAQHKGILGTVIHGSARDLDLIREAGYPLFSRHVFMQSAKNRCYLAKENLPLNIGGMEIHPGDILIADGNGVVAVPRQLAETVLERANAVQKTEEKILLAVAEGMSLSEARKKFQYNTPWSKSHAEPRNN